LAKFYCVQYHGFFDKVTQYNRLFKINLTLD
jgi:hypothetical protein